MIKLLYTYYGDVDMYEIPLLLKSDAWKITAFQNHDYEIVHKFLECKIRWHSEINFHLHISFNLYPTFLSLRFMEKLCDCEERFIGVPLPTLMDMRLHSLVGLTSFVSCKKEPKNKSYQIEIPHKWREPR